jgi:cytosine/adenosine deaminase-related metal-dependent hydrolase
MNAMRTVDLLIRHAYVITVDEADTVIADGAIAVEGRRIVAVGPDAEVAASHASGHVIHAGGAPAHPGLIEGHLHASYQLHRSAIPDDLPKPDVFDTVERVFYDTVNDEEERLAVVLSSMEMIRNGTTTFLEAGTVLTPDAAAAGAELVGIRAVLGDARVVDQSWDGSNLTGGIVRRSPRNHEEALERLGRSAARTGDPSDLVTGHVSLHGMGTASDALLVEAKRRADVAHTVLNFHQSYSPEDTERDRRRWGTDPLVRLHELGVLGANTTLGHANYLTDEEADLVAATGTTMVWAPAASMMWGNGATSVSRHAALWRQGVNIALGSDSGNWSNDFDLFRQANLALLVAREAHRDRTILLAEDVLRMATIGGARAVGKQALIGSLEAGKLADIVIHSPIRPELHPPTNLVRNLIYASRSKSVQTVIVNGRLILEAGHFAHLDEPAMLAKVDAASRGLLARMGYTVSANKRRP